MAVSEQFQLFIEDQLKTFGDVQYKKMFGGIGIFKEGLMFGMISKEVFRLKVDEENRPDYEARGMEPLFMANKKKGMPYWEVPADVIENQDVLVEWSQKAFEAAKRAKK